MMRQDTAPHPRIAAYIRLHARRRPQKIAVIRNGETITYERLDADLRRMIHAITALGVAPGGIAAIGHDDLYIQLLAVFACETLGLASGSYRPMETHECAGLIAAAALVLAQEPVIHPTAGRVVMLTDEWVESLFAAPVPEAVPISLAAPEDLLVIFRSSGTTGKPKLMPTSFRVHRNRDLVRRRIDCVTSRSRYFATMHISVGTVYAAVHRCFRLGATFMFDTSRSAAESLMDLRPTHLTILPYHLRQMLMRLPETDAPLLPGLTIQCIGARTPDELRRLAARKLGCKFLEGYGSNEIGAIGEVDENGIVTLREGVEAQITEQTIGAEKILGPGEIGTLRVRAATLIAGYMNDEAATAEMFKGGWFYPGDLAAITAAGKLRLIGRRADVMNLGGVKIGAAELEARIMVFPSLIDVALIQPSTLNETMRVTVAAVIPRNFNMKGFSDAIRSVLNYPFVIIPVPAIPRTPEGKIQRARLQESLLPPPAAPAPRPLESASSR